jgi:hypothetical protein
LPFWRGFDPVGKFLFTNRNRAESTILIAVGDIMSSKKPAGQPQGSAQKNVNWRALDLLPPDAAGIDVGGSEHWVAVRPERDPEPVRRFGCFTADQHEMGRWLVEKGVRSVAMQSTGVYWIPGFEVLEQHGLEV